MSDPENMGAEAAPQTDDEDLNKALDLSHKASDAGIPLRLVGGFAVRVLCPDYPPRQREGQDLDFASVGDAVKPLTAFLGDHGWEPDRNFNALYGHKQLFFAHADSGQALDVMVDKLEMCHTLEFKSRIERMPYTLDVLDILLSKLQIIELNEKDAQDVVYVLSAYPLNGSEAGAVDVAAFRDLLGSDWGWWRTVTMNLDRITELIERGDHAHIVPDGAKQDPLAALRALRQEADDAPKSFRWKARAKIGDRKRWYEIPEETEHY